MSIFTISRKISRFYEFNIFPQIRYISNITEEKKCDVTIIGGGIIGTSIARQLKQKNASFEVLLIEKENSIGNHQTGHNSGVMHCGVFYPPQSLKAKFCAKGLEMLKTYCNEKHIEYKTSGKLIVATDCNEAKIIDELKERGCKNNVQGMELLNSPEEIRKYSLGCRGVKALWCPQSGNVNFRETNQKILTDFQNHGGKVFLHTKVTNILDCCEEDFPLLVCTENFKILTKYIIICAGLQAGIFAKILEDNSDQFFVSIRANYMKLNTKYCENLTTNIYPVPDFNVPFLGAHFSPLLCDETILLGPHVFPAFKLEGYNNNEMNFPYVSSILTSCNFRNMVVRNFSKCLEQSRQFLCKDTLIQNLQKLLPNIQYQHIEKGPSAVQLQLINSNGTFEEDFVFDIFKTKKRIINLKFTPSPAATSCFAIAEYVVNEFLNKIQTN